MNSSSPWIAALAKQSLLSYLGQNDGHEIQVEDLDGCLYFSYCKPNLSTAIVVSWGQGDNNHRATFTDTKNQIDAIVSTDSPDIQEGTAPCPPSIKGGPRHLIELSDIKLVFTYSSPSPDLYLHIRRFKLHTNAVSKGDVPKPKLRKAPGLKHLMTAAHQKSQISHWNHQNLSSNAQSNHALADSLVSQREVEPHSEHRVFSQPLLSQYPSNIPHGARNSIPLSDHASFGESSGLLGLLAPSRPIQDNEPATKKFQGTYGSSLGESNSRQSLSPNRRALSSVQEHGKPAASTQRTLQRSPSNLANATCASNSLANACYDNLNQQVVNFISEVASHTKNSVTNMNDRSGAHQIDGVDNRQASKKRYRDSTDALMEVGHDDNSASPTLPNPQSVSPRKKRQRTAIEEVIEVIPQRTTEYEAVHNGTVPALLELQTASTTVNPICLSTVDPWEGMIAIPLSEIEIPKDQADLLEDLEWIPQGPGASGALCHVPPRLLTHWNGVAQKGQNSTEAEEQDSERPVTPTQQDLRSSPLSSDAWPPTIAGSPAREALPRDTVSPPRQIKAPKKSPEPSSTQQSNGQITKNDGVDIARSTNCDVSQAGQESVVPSKDKLKPTAQQYPQTLVNITEKPKNLDLPGHYPNTNPSKAQTSRGPLDSNNGQLSSPARERSLDELPPANPPNDWERRGESSGEESDEAEMETSVPFALGGTLPLSSQPEQVITSSGLSLPRVAAGNIQVAETPAVNNARLKTEMLKEQKAGHSLSSPQQPSSEATKTPSMSRVVNTYRSQDSHRHNDVSQYSSGAEDESLQVDVLGTQTAMSDLRAPSPIAIQSSPEVVFDSSRPAQRQCGSSIFHLDPSNDPSPLTYDSSHSLLMSQPKERSQDSLRELSSLDGGSQLPELSPRELTAWTATNVAAPPKSPSSHRMVLDARQKQFHENMELVARRRQDFIRKPDMSAEAQRIYEKFCNDYSPYSGDFAHFTEMCSKLQAMRQKGQLQRSFLWDDFIIQNLEQYPRYFAEHVSQDSKTMDYEEFFCMGFSRPEHKKRSLTAHGLDVVASQFVPPGSARVANLPVLHQPAPQGDVAQIDTVQKTKETPSFTAGLVGGLSNLHAPAPVDIDMGDASNLHVDGSNATQSSLFPSTAASSGDVEIKLEDDPSYELGSLETSTDNYDQKPALSNQDEDIINDSNPDNFPPEPDANDNDMVEAVMEENEETNETDNSHHETASIELGDDADDRHISASPAPPAALGALSSKEPEPSRQRRSWFRSLEKIFPTGPVWSDDPNTPFKRWARQDQNVLQEIRRRGGSQILVDEKGLICRSTYDRPKDHGT